MATESLIPSVVPCSPALVLLGSSRSLTGQLGPPIRARPKSRPTDRRGRKTAVLSRALLTLPVSDSWFRQLTTTWLVPRPTLVSPRLVTRRRPQRRFSLVPRPRLMGTEPRPPPSPRVLIAVHAARPAALAATRPIKGARRSRHMGP